MTSTAIVLPDLRVRDEPVHISSWLVQPGEPLERGDRVVELLLAGVTFDVASPAAGRVDKIRKPAGAVVTSGEIVGWIRVTGERPTGT